VKTRAEALRDVAMLVAEQGAILDSLDPLQAAGRAWHRGGPSVDEIAARFARERCRLDRCDYADCRAPHARKAD
jgi:hypothetical protein